VNYGTCIGETMRLMLLRVADFSEYFSIYGKGSKESSSSTWADIFSSVIRYPRYGRVSSHLIHKPPDIKTNCTNTLLYTFHTFVTEKDDIVALCISIIVWHNRFMNIC